MTYCLFGKNDGALVPEVTTVMAGQPGITL